MSLPTRSDVLTLDFTGYGQPAAYIEAKTLSPSSATLDYTLAGQPAFGLPDGAVTLLPSLYSNANTFYAATVTRIGQPVHATGTVKRRRFKPVILSDLFVIKSTNGAIAVSGFDVSLSLTKLMAFGETVIPASATIRQHEIISEDIPVRAFSNWNDPTDDELKLILDFALGDNSLIDLCHSLMVLSRPMESYETTDGMKVE